VAALLAISVIASFEYYRQLRRLRTEYERARGAVEDIILSFNRQFEREAQKVEILGYKVEAARSRDEGAVSKAQEAMQRSESLEVKFASVSEAAQALLPRLANVEVKVLDAVASQESLQARVSELEERSKEAIVAREPSLSVIPIKREKALAQLTETEVIVIELLVSEGAKTAPEIKERVKLSREHTARLMKKLYEEGYLERETGKIPFKYSAKKEMEKFVKKPQNQTS
jgi:predicted DNA-binding transcriptional regulator